jgi:hypothetical protein
MTLSRGLALVGALLVLTACGGAAETDGGVSAGEPTEPVERRSDSSSAEPSPTTSGPSAGCPARRDESMAGARRVFVYFWCDGETDPGRTLYVVPRPVAASVGVEGRLRVAVSAYFRGPAARDGEHLHAFGPPGTLNSVVVVGPRAVIDLDMSGGLGSTSAQSSIVWSTLKALAFQFAEIDEMEPRFNGSCKAFGMAVEAGECLVATRSGGYLRGR